jgi:DNA-binding protein YbaB
VDSLAAEVKRLKDSQKQHSKRLNDARDDRAKLECKLDALEQNVAKMKPTPQSDGGLVYADHREAYRDEVCRNTQDIKEVMERERKALEQITALSDVIAKLQEELDAMELEASSRDGRATVWLSGNQQPLKVRLAPELLAEGQEASELAVLEALKAAYELSTGTMKGRMEELTGGLNLNLPGFGG